MERSQNAELAKRINHTFTLLQKGITQPQLVEKLVQKYGISQIQAYRYVSLAKEINEKMAIPESSVVFTVKLPPSLIRRIRKLSDTQNLTISRVVHTALEEFLAKRDHAKKGETS